LLKLITGEVLFGENLGTFNGNIKVGKPYTFFQSDKGVGIGPYDATLIQYEMGEALFKENAIVYITPFDNKSFVDTYQTSVSPLILPTQKIII
jgi:hypothetical protein